MGTMKCPEIMYDDGTLTYVELKKRPGFFLWKVHGDLAKKNNAIVALNHEPAIHI
jgi:hypothetical protein